MGEISDEELRDVVEEVMLEEIQTLRVGLEDWKKVAQDWAKENLATAKRLVEAEVEVERLRAEVERLREKVSDMRGERVRIEAARDEAVREAIWRIENETRAAGERDKARAEVARLRGLVAAITNLITNPASIEHGLVMTDEISEPFAEGDAELRSSQTCACSSAYREIGPGIHARYCALAGQPMDDGRQRWRCTACAAVSTVDRCPQCGGMMIAADP
jgi:polyhydroxyalkanoate synthesis regulator phasin